VCSEAYEIVGLKSPVEKSISGPSISNKATYEDSLLDL
jgi:hypothetical protein